MKYIINLCSPSDKNKVITIEANSCEDASAQAATKYPSHEIVRITSTDYAVKYYDEMKSIKRKDRFSR